MTEEEKNAIEIVKGLAVYYDDYSLLDEEEIEENESVNKSIELILNLIEKLQKENRILKEEKEQAWEEWNNLEQGSYETELKLKEENKKLKAEIKNGVIAIKLYALQKENEQLRTEVNSLKKDNERYQELELQILESEE